MALTKAPLFGLDASGTVAGAIVFSKWKGRTYVRRHAVPHNPKSGLQVGMRAGFKFVAQDYTNLSAAIVARWKAIADLTATTPLNAQMQYSQRNIRLGLGCVQDPAAAAGTTPTIVAGTSATAAPKSLILVWAHPVTTPGDYATYIWMSETGTFTRSTATLIAVVAQADLTYTVRGLTTGTQYFFEVAEGNTDGEIGVSSAEFNGTPT
jgi:hypothetical protein